MLIDSYLILLYFIYSFNIFNMISVLSPAFFCVMTGVEHLDIFDLGIAWKGYPKAAASWR